MTDNKLIISCFKPIPDLTQNTVLIACPIMIHNYGLPYYLEGFRSLLSAYPHLNLTLAIPAQDDVGLALKALDSGVKVVYFDRHSKAWSQLITMAATYGAEVRNQGELYG